MQTEQPEIEFLTVDQVFLPTQSVILEPHLPSGDRLRTARLLGLVGKGSLHHPSQFSRAKWESQQIARA